MSEITPEEALRAAGWASRVGMALPAEYLTVLLNHIASLEETIAVLSDKFTMAAIEEAWSER